MDDSSATTTAIDDALRNAGLRAGDSSMATASTLHVEDPADDFGSGAGGDGAAADGD